MQEGLTELEKQYKAMSQKPSMEALIGRRPERWDFGGPEITVEDLRRCARCAGGIADIDCPDCAGQAYILEESGRAKLRGQFRHGGPQQQGQGQGGGHRRRRRHRHGRDQ